MKIYDFYYRLKKDKNAEILCKTFVSLTKQKAIMMAKSEIGKEYVIIEIKIN